MILINLQWRCCICASSMTVHVSVGDSVGAAVMGLMLAIVADVARVRDCWYREAQLLQLAALLVAKLVHALTNSFSCWLLFVIRQECLCGKLRLEGPTWELLCNPFVFFARDLSAQAKEQKLAIVAGRPAHLPPFSEEIESRFYALSIPCGDKNRRAWRCDRQLG